MATFNLFSCCLYHGDAVLLDWAQQFYFISVSQNCIDRSAEANSGFRAHFLKAKIALLANHLTDKQSVVLSIQV